MSSGEALRHSLILAAFVLMETPSVAQTNFGQINGTITDPSGTEVAGAKVALQSLETSAERQVVSNSTGTYVISTVPPGRYALTVTAPGFQTFKIAEFRLQSGGRSPAAG